MLLKKGLPFLFALLLPMQTSIPGYLAFVIDNNELIWSQVYEDDRFPPDALPASMFKYLDSRTWINNIKFEDEDIVADISNYKMDYKRYGASFMKTSTIIRTGRWTAKLRVSFKDSKYRVVIYGINYTAVQPTTGSGRATLEAREIDGTLSEWALTNLRTSIKKSWFDNLDIVHHNLKKSFTIVSYAEMNREW